MSRYLQRISLFPFSTSDVWVGWELEGVDGEVEGLIQLSALPDEELSRLQVEEFQLIPAEYLQDFTRSIR